MKKRTIAKLNIIAVALVLTLSGCKNNESNTEETVLERTEKVTETVGTETEQDKANREKLQESIAKAKAESQTEAKTTEVVMEDNKGVLQVASTHRNASIPTYIYFPEGYNAEETYPLVVMFPRFSSSHDNGGTFGDMTDLFTKNGLIVLQYDNPGYGESKEDNLAYTLTNVKNDAADVIKYVLDNYNISKVGALGFDVGGRVAMEMQVDKMFDFDQIELMAPYSEAKEFIHNCFGEENWEELRTKALRDGTVTYGVQIYSKEWFTDWEKSAKTLTDDFSKAYKGRKSMVVFSTDDEEISLASMDNLYKKLGAAAICVTAGGHELCFGYDDEPKDVIRVIESQSLSFMEALKEK